MEGTTSTEGRRGTGGRKETTVHVHEETRRLPRPAGGPDLGRPGGTALHEAHTEVVETPGTLQRPETVVLGVGPCREGPVPRDVPPTRPVPIGTSLPSQSDGRHGQCPLTPLGGGRERGSV